MVIILFLINFHRVMPGCAFGGNPFKFIWVIAHGGAARYGKKQKAAEADFHIDFKRPVHRAVGYPY